MTSFRGAIKRLNCDSKISAIFFDLDNTLIATRKADAKASSKVADLLHREHGFGRELANETATNYLTAFRRCPDNPDMALVQWRSQLWYDVLPATHQHLATELYGRWLEWRYRYLALPDEVHTMLQTLRLQYLLGIITNGPTAAQWEKIDRLALNKYFDCILVSSDLPWAKPDRNIFYAACHYLGVPPGQCVMIGDKLETDIQFNFPSHFPWFPARFKRPFPEFFNGHKQNSILKHQKTKNQNQWNCINNIHINHTANYYELLRHDDAALLVSTDLLCRQRLCPSNERPDYYDDDADYTSVDDYL
ncbi:N-acylneuraminate-9-phosphatase-like isoform X2 [Anopheles aquasalis]|uniref:N-acylneuraminate-9-phosphatase-like isoform X2 n=1 Tax=Anopheles aquasalis TaxID=42839 RepID=UPI00215AE742|nr:N-acylneuraminate-9-phosphatase-like isoform X2 [Anopheles aquasalis]